MDSFDEQQRQAVEAATTAGARALEGSHALVRTINRNNGTDNSKIVAVAALLGCHIGSLETEAACRFNYTSGENKYNV